MAFKIIHDLSKLDDIGLTQYKRDASTYIGLDPELNGLDTIWMANENGIGQSLVIYARRGTAEILRNLYGVNVDTLTSETIAGSVVFTATGTNGKGRKEIAKGAKYIETLTGKTLDNAIMTASTRALRRLTMQFTGLGILDESEVHAVEPNTVNPAAGVTLAPALPPPAVAPNSAPGKVVEPPPAQVAPPAPAAPPQAPVANFATHQAEFIAEAKAQLNAKAAKQADILQDTKPAIAEVKPEESTSSPAPEAAVKPARKPRKARNSVTLSDVEPETVAVPAQVNDAVTPEVLPAPVIVAPVIPAIPVSAPVSVVVPAPAPPTPAPAAQPSSDFPGKPSEVQMSDYRKKISVYTAELPSSENMGSVQKMRAFITHMSGSAPQYMTVDQWDETLGWFESFVGKNQVKGLVKYINTSLGVN